jgi:hypothetical protein
MNATQKSIETLGEITYKDANGNTRYWKTQSGAWNFANKLNAELTNGSWAFENEYLKGFYLEFKADN